MRTFKSARRAQGWVVFAAALVALATGLLVSYLAGGSTVWGVVLVVVFVTALFSVPLALFVRARRQKEDLLRRHELHDPLTGLPNRSLFVERVERALLRAGEEPGSIAVLFVDLDDFEEINCSLGHEEGDRLLAVSGQRLEAVVGSKGVVSRLGGDAFTVLLEDVPDKGSAISAAERIGESLEAPLKLGESKVSASASIGVAIGGSAKDSPESLLREAYVAMRAAKKKGKARCRVFDPGANTTTSRRSLAEAEMRRAIREKEFRVYYQPQVELETERILGVEALVRWRHPVYGLIPPGEFIPLAEQTGLIRPIGRWVLHEACRQVRLWQTEHAGGPPLVLSVNVSACQFSQPNLAKEVLGILEETGLDPRYLKLEITESVMMHDVPAVAALRELKGSGIELAMDDFGTGYSNLSYLKRLPIDCLKIDRSYVNGLGGDAGDTAIVHATVAFAKALGLNVTAEGIENAEQLAQLRELGCEMGQGYHFAKPLPSDEAAKLLSAGVYDDAGSSSGDGPRVRRTRSRK